MFPLRHTPQVLLLAAVLTLGSGYPLRPTHVAAPSTAGLGAALPPAQVTAEAPGDGKATPGPEKVKSDVDAALSDHLAKLLAFQVEYFNAHGRYFQALDSHAAPPEDGKLTEPDDLAKGPTDQDEKSAYLWQQLELDAALPYSSRVDVYHGPDGLGYVLTVSVVLDKQLWERAINTGPEIWRERPWQVVVEERQP